MGLPCVFVRLAGCNLDCSYCDTGYAKTLDGSEKISIKEIVNRVSDYRVPLVELTGGEPLLQKETPELIRRLLELDYTVLVETNGSLDISFIDRRAHLIIDIKTPGSGVAGSFYQSNLPLLQSHHQIKFVLLDEADFLWSIDFIEQYLQNSKTKEIIFSPVVSSFKPAVLAELMLKYRVQARLQLQLHTILWPNCDRGC